MAHQSGSKPSSASQQAKTGMQQLLKSLDNMQQPLYWLNAYFLRFAVPRDFHLGVGTWLNRAQLVFPREVSLPEISGRARPLWKGASPQRRENSIRAGESCFKRKTHCRRSHSSWRGNGSSQLAGATIFSQSGKNHCVVRASQTST